MDNRHERNCWMTMCLISPKKILRRQVSFRNFFFHELDGLSRFIASHSIVSNWKGKVGGEISLSAQSSTIKEEVTSRYCCNWCSTSSTSQCGIPTRLVRGNDYHEFSVHLRHFCDYLIVSEARDSAKQCHKWPGTDQLDHFGETIYTPFVRE